MIKVENVEVSGWEAAFRGLRNPKNSWDKSDSGIQVMNLEDVEFGEEPNYEYIIGPNDLQLSTALIKAGPEHRKFLRMIHVSMDITAPLYWWKEMDTYKVGTTADSCSTMHKITAKEFELDDFSHEHLFDDPFDNESPMYVLWRIIDSLNFYRERYLKSKDKNDWWQLIQLLPTSYNQKRTWDGSMETVLSILHQRKGHKLDEWETLRQAIFERVPYVREFYDALYGKEKNNASN